LFDSSNAELFSERDLNRLAAVGGLGFGICQMTTRIERRQPIRDVLADCERGGGQRAAQLGRHTSSSWCCTGAEVGDLRDDPLDKPGDPRALVGIIELVPVRVRDLLPSA
jgi:hypothetical protein